MGIKKKVYKTTAEWKKDYSRKATQKNIRLANTYTKRKFGGLVNRLAEQGQMYKKSTEFIKHLYQVVGKGEQGTLIKIVTSGIHGKNDFLKTLNKAILKDGYSTILKDVKQRLKIAKQKDTEGNRYYQKLAKMEAKAKAKGQEITKAQKIILKAEVKREVYVARMKAALARPDLSKVLRQLLEDSLKAMGLL